MGIFADLALLGKIVDVVHRHLDKGVHRGYMAAQHSRYSIRNCEGGWNKGKTYVEAQSL